MAASPVRGNGRGPGTVLAEPLVRRIRGLAGLGPMPAGPRGGSPDAVLTLKDIARLYAERYGGSRASALRWLGRVHPGSRVDQYEADRWCVLLGLHPSDLFEDWWDVA